MTNLVQGLSTRCASKVGNLCDFKVEYLFLLLIPMMDGMHCVFIRNVECHFSFRVVHLRIISGF